MTEELIPYVPQNTEKKTKWSQREDAIIYAKIDQSPQNLMAAFDAAALELPHRSAHAVQLRWYNTLKNRDKAAVIVASKGTAIQKNVKNTARAITNSSGEIKLQDVMKDVISLTRSQRDVLRKYLALTEA